MKRLQKVKEIAIKHNINLDIDSIVNIISNDVYTYYYTNNKVDVICLINNKLHYINVYNDDNKLYKTIMFFNNKIIDEIIYTYKEKYGYVFEYVYKVADKFKQTKIYYNNKIIKIDSDSCVKRYKYDENNVLIYEQNKLSLNTKKYFIYYIIDMLLNNNDIKQFICTHYNITNDIVKYSKYIKTQSIDTLYNIYTNMLLNNIYINDEHNIYIYNEVEDAIYYYNKDNVNVLEYIKDKLKII